MADPTLRLDAGNAIAGGPHWEFSLALYGGDGVREACLYLQDTHGVDVNILLCCAFRMTQGLVVDDTLLASVDAAVAGWRDQVILPLRKVRRQLGAMATPPSAASASAVRRPVADAELLAEKAEQNLIRQVFEGDDRREPDLPPRDALPGVVAFFARRSDSHPFDERTLAKAALISRAAYDLRGA